MWDIVIAEFSYNRGFILYLSIFFIGVLVLAVSDNMLSSIEIEGLYISHSDSAIRMLRLTALFAFALSMMKENKTYRALLRILPVSGRVIVMSEIIAQLIILTLTYACSLSVLVLFKGSISLFAINYFVVDLSLLIILFICVNGSFVDIWDYRRKRIVVIMLVAQSLLFIFIAFVIVNFFKIDILFKIHELLESGFNPFILLVFSAASVFARIKMYENRDQYFKD